MTGEDGDQYGFYINITDNIVREVKTQKKPAGEDETGRPGGVTHWLQKQIYPYILDNEEEKKFRRTFLKEELLRIFQTGQRHIQLGYRFRKGKYITCYTVNIEMFEHPVDHTVECCAIWRNDTIPYINRVMTHMLLRDKYRMIAVLDIQENTVFVRNIRLRTRKSHVTARWSMRDSSSVNSVKNVYRKRAENGFEPLPV